MTSLFTPPQMPISGAAHTARVTQAQDRPKANYDLAWIAANGHPEWQSRMLPDSPAVEAAVTSLSRGALLASPRGPVAIEDVVPGMQLTTARGTQETVKWVGARSYAPHHEKRPILFRVNSEAFGHRAPERDLILAGTAAVLLNNPGCRNLIGQDQAFAPLSAFEDGYNITRITPMGEITVYNLAFDAQEAVLANGLPVETFHPGRNSMQFLSDEVLRDMARLFPHLTPATGFGPQRLPRLSVTEARSLSVV